MNVLAVQTINLVNCTNMSCIISSICALLVGYEYLYVYPSGRESRWVDALRDDVRRTVVRTIRRLRQR